SSDAGSNNNSVGPPSTTTPATTPVTAVSATTFPPSTTAPAASTETPTTITNTPTASTVLSSSGSASETSTPTSTTKAPATTTSPTATKTTAPTTTPSATADPDTSSAATTAAPVVKQYNSSTLPPSVSSSVLNGSDLVNVEVTETTLGNTMDPTSSNYSEAASDQSGSSRSDRNTSNSSGSLGLGTIIGIIVGVLVFLLALLVFLIVQHRRRRNRSIEMPSDTILAAVEKQMQLQDRGQSLVDTDYEESTRTFGYSQVSGAPLSGSRRHRATLWEHPLIVASRIPVDHIELGEIISHGAFGMDYLATGAPQGMDTSKMQIAYDVAYALTYLHSLEPAVLHRDLKSRNILLTESLTAKITDFGTSRIRFDGSMTSNVGSSLWMAPEVMMGRRYDEKADVFSLGVVMSELDTHELPYSHVKSSNNKKGRPLPDTAVLQMVSMGKLQVRFSPFMDQDIRHFIERCVNVNPCERPTAAEVLYYLQVLIRHQQH
ncbi:hypothetical protein JG688_00007857, partial [Phytophthora aleatoria]